MIDIIDKKNETSFTFKEDKPIFVYNTSNISETISILSKFVGESVPVLDKKSNKIIGIISENDVLKAYSQISNEIRSIEK